MYKTEAKLIKKFNTRQKVEEIAVEENGILYCKSRILEGQTIKVVGGIKLSTDLESMLGLNFKVPLIEKYSPLALPLALHIHDIFNHKGSESIYRLSLRLVRLLRGKQLFRSVGLDCVICLKNRKHLLK